ncbi:MAG: 16S rRNA (cytidine(1402)-2'-O)-methyltransferase [Gammaproteobacteria bacterium]
MASGTLYIVATPLGNLQDFTYRGVETLSTVALIAAEDTRHTATLLQQYGITTPCVAYHSYNEEKATMTLLQRLSKGDSVALVSDAGTPLISDPGYALVQQARKQGITVVPVPGPCAAIAALSVSGLPTHGFLFVGFLSPKVGTKTQQLKKIAHETVPLIIYEAPHRLKATLDSIRAVMGDDRQVMLGKEITKQYEQFFQGTSTECLTWIDADAQRLRGEWVIMVAGRPKDRVEDGVSGEGERIMAILLESLPLKQAAQMTAKITGDSKNALYDWGLKQ